MNETSIQNLSDYGHILKGVCPGMELHRDQFGGVTATWGVRVTHSYDRAVSADHAEQLVLSLAEQIRGRAIRELGLRPILDAQEREVKESRDIIRSLQALADQRATRIAELLEEVERLTEPDD